MKFYPTHSNIEMKLFNRVGKAAKALTSQSTSTQDSLTNLIAGLMDGRDKMAYNQYALRKVVGREELITMYRSNWLARKIVFRKKLRRDQMIEFFVNLPPCLIGMEACGSAHHWARKLQSLGHTVQANGALVR